MKALASPSGTDVSEFRPSSAGERIVTVDILRGFALFGILVVNMELFNHSVFDYILGAQPERAIDQAAAWFVKFFFEGKFYSIFSFLFGLGMAIFMERAEARGVRFVPLYLRRLLGLLVFGLIHAYLFWVGDILILYSVIGFLTLVLFRKCRPRTLMIWSLLFLLVPILVNLALTVVVMLGRQALGSEMDELLAQSVDVYAQAAAQGNHIYASGSWPEVTRQRANDMVVVYASWPFMAFNLWATFLLGLAAGKARLHEQLPHRKKFLRNVLIWGAVVGLAANAIFVYAGSLSNRGTPSMLNWISTTAQTIGAPALALCYMSALTLLAAMPNWQPRLLPLAFAGRMAITNYLMQSVICTWLFYGYGFGWYGIGQAATLVLALGIWLVEVGWSVWWLQRFRFGPVEWLWRAITYWEWQPMRRAPVRVAPGQAEH